MTLITRFAPSPTGLLHLGSVRTAASAHARARAAGGRFLLRMEDIDQARCRPHFAAAIREDLRWLGLLWDGDVRVQSEHFSDYRAALDSLRARRLVYPCFCSRADIARAAAAPHGAEEVYPGTCRCLPPAEAARRVAAGQPHAWRLDLARAMPDTPLFVDDEAQGQIRCDPLSFGDVVLARRDTPASYHLAATHDDALQGVSLVVRGEDLRPAAHLHRLLQHLMGWPAPRYAHVALKLGADGRRLAKRDHAATVRALREAGVAPGKVVARALA
ncbi:MAG: tRNA glutamyl-Q(34) synthetase GluQRS [Rhodospirillales bacterium]|nr:tRNA glutamyl-Q(34) synthetase GluQRS [Rhodospirillales bacterium]